MVEDLLAFGGGGGLTDSPACLTALSSCDLVEKPFHLLASPILVRNGLAVPRTAVRFMAASVLLNISVNGQWSMSVPVSK